MALGRREECRPCVTVRALAVTVPVGEIHPRREWGGVSGGEESAALRAKEGTRRASGMERPRSQERGGLSLRPDEDVRPGRRTGGRARCPELTPPRAPIQRSARRQVQMHSWAIPPRAGRRTGRHSALSDVASELRVGGDILVGDHDPGVEEDQQLLAGDELALPFEEEAQERDLVEVRDARALVGLRRLLQPAEEDRAAIGDRNRRPDALDLDLRQLNRDRVLRTQRRRLVDGSDASASRSSGAAPG